jgi:hypothetical protein
MNGGLTVVRRYGPEGAVLDQLVDALYQLLMDAPSDPSAPAPAPGGIGLPFRPARVRNVS